MRTGLFLAMLALSSLFLAAAPVASAGHCAQYPLVQEATCEANHAANDAVNTVLCFYWTAPAYWGRTCIPPIVEIDGDVLLP